MKNTLPLVSVIIPTYNRPEMLVEAIQSVLNQTYNNYEIVVINDNGVNIENLVSKLNTNKRILYIKHNKNKGLAAARNTGIRNANGKYIAYLDDDDIYYPNHLETLVNHLETEDCSVAYTNAYRALQEWQDNKYVITKKDLPYTYDFDYNRILIENFIPVLCVMHEKKCLEKSDIFDENFTRFEDWDLWIRVAKLYSIKHIDKITCEFRVRDDGTSMSSQNRCSFAWATINILYKYLNLEKKTPSVFRKQRETFIDAVLCVLNSHKDGKSDNISVFTGNKSEEAISRLYVLKDWYGWKGREVDDLVYLLKKAEEKKPLQNFYDASVNTIREGNQSGDDLSENESLLSSVDELKLKDEQIKALRMKKEELESKLERIYKSRGWKILNNYYIFRDSVIFRK